MTVIVAVVVVAVRGGRGGRQEEEEDAAGGEEELQRGAMSGRGVEDGKGRVRGNYKGDESVIRVHLGSPRLMTGEGYHKHSVGAILSWDGISAASAAALSALDIQLGTSFEIAELAPH